MKIVIVSIQLLKKPLINNFLHSINSKQYALRMYSHIYLNNGAVMFFIWFVKVERLIVSSTTGAIFHSP